MKIQIKNTTVVIADDSESALRIKDGWNCSLDEKGRLEVRPDGDKIVTKYQAMKRVRSAKDLEELKLILIEMLENNLIPIYE